MRRRLENRPRGSIFGMDDAYPTKLRQWRKYRHLTQMQAADRMGIDYTTLGRIERGIIEYTQGVLEAAAVAYNCEPWDLLHVDPLKEGQVIDMTRMLKGADPVVVAEIMGFARGRLGKQ